MLVGIDAHAMHHFAKLTGSRYQDIVARLAPRTMPAPQALTLLRLVPGHGTMGPCPSSGRPSGSDCAGRRAEDLPGFVALHTDPRTYEHAPGEHADEAAVPGAAGLVPAGLGGVRVRLPRRRGARHRATGRLGRRPAHGMEPRTLNLYYRLAHDALGRGYGRELALAIVAGVREELPDHTVRAIDQAPQPGLDGHRAGRRPRRGRREA